MPTGVTYVTKKHSFLVKGTLTHLALRIIRGGLAREEMKDGTGPVATSNHWQNFWHVYVLSKLSSIWKMCT